MVKYPTFGRHDMIQRDIDGREELLLRQFIATQGLHRFAFRDINLLEPYVNYIGAAIADFGAKVEQRFGGVNPEQGQFQGVILRPDALGLTNWQVTPSAADTETNWIPSTSSVLQLPTAAGKKIALLGFGLINRLSTPNLKMIKMEIWGSKSYRNWIPVETTFRVSEIKFYPFDIPTYARFGESIDINASYHTAGVTDETQVYGVAFAEKVQAEDINWTS